MKKDVVVFGNQKLAQLAHFYLKHDSSYRVAAFTVDRPYVSSPRYQGLPLVPFDEVQKRYPPARFGMLVSIGYKNLNRLRAAKMAEAKKKGYRLISYVCSKAVVWPEVAIGENCFILENQILQPFVKVGDGVVLWGNCHFGHDAVIGDHCWVSPHSAACGGVRLGDRTFVGTNVTIRDNVVVGKECIIGAGSVIHHDMGDREVHIAKAAQRYPLDSEQFCKMTDISRDL